MRREKVIVGIIILVFLGLCGFAFFRIYAGIEIKDYNEKSNNGDLLVEDIKNNNKKISEVLESVTPCVVGISKMQNIGNSIFSENSVSTFGIGSGIIVSKNGYILTNEHVSGGKGSDCFITIEDGKEYKGSVVWSDSALDLAIVKLNINFLDGCKLGDSDKVKVGETVYAIGNPIGYEFQRTVTSGIISALNRTIKFNENDKEVYMSNLIQTDATINPGNSGGPLINCNGEVVGINSVKITSADGIGFSIPINIVKPIIEKLDKTGKFDEAWLGIFAYDKDVVPYLNYNKDFKEGIYVNQVTFNSPAYKSGLQVGDCIIKIDDVMLNKMSDLRQYIFLKNVGDVVDLEVIRNNKKLNFSVTLSRKN